jgi:hypothetical protein
VRCGQDGIVGTLNKGATYWVCGTCDEELRACGGLDRKAVWDCPTAAEGKRGCKCCCKPKQAARSGKRRKAIFTPSKKHKADARRKKKFREGDK